MALPARRAVALVLPLLDALAIAHKQGIIHGGLHPGNVLLHGNGFRAMLTDFGVRGAYEMLLDTSAPYLAPEAAISPGRLARISRHRLKKASKLAPFRRTALRTRPRSGSQPP